MYGWAPKATGTSTSPLFFKVIFEINSKNGVLLDGVSSTPQEQEVLMDRNSKFKVVGKEPPMVLGDTPVYKILLEEI